MKILKDRNKISTNLVTLNLRGKSNFTSFCINFFNSCNTAKLDCHLSRNCPSSTSFYCTDDVSFDVKLGLTRKDDFMSRLIMKPR